MILNQYKPVLSMEHKEIFCFVNIIIMYVPKNFVILLQENGLIFFQNYFYSGSVYMRRIRQCTVDARSASWGGVAGPRPFFKTLIIYKITTRKWLNIFAWFILHWVCISLN